MSTNIANIYIDTLAVANYLNIKRKSVYPIIHREKIPYIKIGRFYRFKLSDFLAWLQSKTVNPLEISRQV